MKPRISDDSRVRSDEPAERRKRPSSTKLRSRSGANDLLHCASCGAEVPEGRRSCPVCHRGVYRTCVCGWQLPATESTCPNCEADWSQSTRVARKSKSRKPQTRGAIRYALVGAAVAIIAAMLIQVVVAGLANVAVGAQQPVPTGFGERVGLAVDAVGDLVGRAGTLVVEHGATILLVVGIMAAGALAGIGAYVLQKRKAGGRSSRSSRRVRRKRRE